MDKSFVNTLAKPWPNRLSGRWLAFIILTCTIIFIVLRIHSHPEFGTWGPYQAYGGRGSGHPPPFGEPGPGRHPHLRPDFVEIDGKADDGPPPVYDDDTDLPPSYYSVHHHTVNGLEVSPPPPPADEDEYVAICLMVKDVSLELCEFLTHHYYHHGIRKFYIYDDGSDPPLSEYPEVGNYNVPDQVLNFTYIAPETVPEDERVHLQDHTMERCIRENGHKHHWMGLLDPDEYLEMRHNQFPTLLSWLKHWETDSPRNETVGALAVSWLPHNSASLDAIPTTGFRAPYTTCVSGDGPNPYLIRHSKSFVRPQFVDGIPNIHMVSLNNDTMHSYGEQGERVGDVTRSPLTHEYWALHHYATGSRKYFEQKAGKGRSQGPGMWPVDEGYWDRYHDGVTSYECKEMQKFVP